MDLSLNEDQRAILDALDGLCRPYQDAPLHDAPLTAISEKLDAEIAEAGFLDVAADPDLGTVSAAVIVERLARLPYATEAAASAFFRPLLGEVEGPICIVDRARTPRMLRYLVPGATVLVVEDSRVSVFTASQDQLRAEPDALLGYPVASLLEIPDERQVCDIAPIEARTRWQAAIAAETAGLLAAALASTVSHVSEREQFGRKLATFQALRHRLAEAQVLTNGTYWLSMKAAATLDPADAAMAASYAQEAARSCSYDFHQFLGAMGMTLEHPLHMWTYRLKALVGELGGRKANAARAADALWGAAS
ncbi:acyl-CoA dehydrogenase family protein [Erythrobacter alti]|uniref:acyl-CoA dehydrogenase family protein n=1 Tax=Erythrobacter alti TaxID=1896145 RepID=UPI0030F42931